MEQAQLEEEHKYLNLRKDLKIKLLRGNVDTRIKKLRENNYDAIILSFAGLKRLGLLDQVTEELDDEQFSSCSMSRNCWNTSQNVAVI